MAERDKAQKKKGRPRFFGQPGMIVRNVSLIHPHGENRGRGERKGRTLSFFQNMEGIDPEGGSRVQAGGMDSGMWI